MQCKRQRLRTPDLKPRHKILRLFLRSLVVTRSSEFPAVALCLVAATTFWFLNSLNREYTTEISYPIRFEYDNGGFIPTQPLPRRIAINVTAQGWNLLRKTWGLKTNPIVYRIPRPSSTRYLTGPALLPTASEQLLELKVNFVRSDTIALAFDRRATKTVYLRPDSSQIGLRENFLINSPVRVSPSEITFSGPASLIKKIPGTLAVIIPSSDIDENYDEEIGLDYRRDPLLTPSVSRVNVSFEVAEYIRERLTVPVDAIRLANNKLLRFPVRDAEVEYWVLPADAGKAAVSDFQVVADLKNWNRADSSIALAVIRQPGFVRKALLRTPTVKLVR